MMYGCRMMIEIGQKLWVRSDNSGRWLPVRAWCSTITPEQDVLVHCGRKQGIQRWLVPMEDVRVRDITKHGSDMSEGLR